jgi:hypothetical protein
VDDYEDPTLPVRELSPGWWIMSPAAVSTTGCWSRSLPRPTDTDARWTVHCERGDETWLMKATPGWIPRSAIMPEPDFPT